MIETPYRIYNRSLYLEGYKSLVERLGGNAEELVESVGIPPEALSNPHIILCHDAVLEAMELAAERFEAPTFGLTMVESGPAQSAGGLGPHLLLARLVDTLREWFELGIRYWAFHTNSSTSALLMDPEAGTATIRYLDLVPGSMTPQYVDASMALMVKLGRIGTGQPELSPNCMRFRREAPPDVGQHQRFFGCEVEFGAAHDELVVDSALLDMPTRGDLSMFRNVADLYMRYAMARVSGRQQSLEVSVNHAIVALLPTGTCSFDAVAQVVGLSPKKLQRQLAAEGKTYSGLLDLCREETARKLLAETRIPVEQIAGLLGYGSGVAFAIAFNRWAGTAPTGYRKRQQGDRRNSARPGD